MFVCVRVHTENWTNVYFKVTHTFGTRLEFLDLRHTREMYSLGTKDPRARQLIATFSEKIFFEILNEKNSEINLGEENYSGKVVATGLLSRVFAVHGTVYIIFFLNLDRIIKQNVLLVYPKI